MSLESLYQEILLDHYRRPRNFGDSLASAVTTEHDNPLCGDRISLSVSVTHDRVDGVQFSGQGCAICTASTSMLTERVRGLTTGEARRLAESFRRMMRREEAFDAELLGELAALEGVVKYPTRVKCATLGWTCLEDCLQQATEPCPAHRQE